MSSLLFIQPTDPGIDWFQRMPLLYNPLTLDETQQPKTRELLPAVRRDAWCPHKLQLIFGCLNGPSHLICQLEGWCQLEHITGKGELKPYTATPITTNPCLLWICFVVVSEYRKFQKKIHQPELDWKYYGRENSWTYYLQLPFLGDVTTVVTSHQTSSFIKMWPFNRFTVSHNHGAPPLQSNLYPTKYNKGILLWMIEICCFQK